MKPLPESSSPPADFPPLPDGTYYAGTLADHEGDIEGYVWHPGMNGKWNNGDDEPRQLKGMAIGPDCLSAKWHVALLIPAENTSPHPCGASSEYPDTIWLDSRIPDHWMTKEQAGATPYLRTGCDPAKEIEYLKKLLARVSETGGPLKKAIAHAGFPSLAADWTTLEAQIKTAIEP